MPPAPVPTPTPAPAPPTPQPVSPQLTTLLAVAGATYGQGTDDNGADDYSKPEHQATVKPFYIEATEVTNEQYKVFVDKTGHTPPKEGWVNGAPKPGTEDWPVIYVTWDDATAYATVGRQALAHRVGVGARRAGNGRGGSTPGERQSGSEEGQSRQGRQHRHARAGRFPP